MGESENEKLLKNLQILIKKRDIEKIKTLIRDARFDVNTRDLSNDLQTPLMKLCYSEIPDTSLLEIVDILLDRNADLNIQDSLGRTAVMHACIARRTTIADYLISDPTTRLEIFDFDGNSVLSHSVKSIDFIITKRILDHPSGTPLLEIYNSNGQKPLHISIKTGNKKIVKIIEQYEAKLPKAKAREKQLKLEHDCISALYSPRADRNIVVKRGSNSTTAITLNIDNKSEDDESDHAVSLTSARLGRSKRTAELFSPELVLPSISEKAEKNQGKKSEPSVSRRKARRNSVSLPDLRDTPLVRSGENTPVVDIDTPETEEDDDNAFVNTSKSPRKKLENRLFRKCISENQISFPSIVSKNGTPNSQVKRTLTESSIFSNSDDSLSRTMHRLL